MALGWLLWLAQTDVGLGFAAGAAFGSFPNHLRPVAAPRAHPAGHWARRAAESSALSCTNTPSAISCRFRVDV